VGNTVLTHNGAVTITVANTAAENTSAKLRADPRCGRSMLTGAAARATSC